MEMHFQNKVCIRFKSQKVVRWLIQCFIVLLPKVVATQMNHKKTDCIYGTVPTATQGHNY